MNGTIQTTIGTCEVYVDYDYTHGKPQVVSVEPAGSKGNILEGISYKEFCRIAKLCEQDALEVLEQHTDKLRRAGL